MDTVRLVRRAETLYSLCKRASVSEDRDGRRAELITEFTKACTDAGLIAERKWDADWTRVQMAIVDLHSTAVYADEGRAGTFIPLGGISAMAGALRGLAAVLGFILEDAATAKVEHSDDDAMADVEGWKAAAE